MFAPFGEVIEIWFLSFNKNHQRPPHNGACFVKFQGPLAVRAAYEAIETLNRKVVLPTCPVLATSP
jgi:hypothetical protein